MMNLSIGSLNFQDAGSWPLWQKAAVCAAILVIIVAAGVLLVWRDQYTALENAENEEIRLKKDYTDRKTKTINHDLYIEQLDQIQQAFGALVKKLPEKSEIDALLVDVNQAGIARGLQFDLFKPAPQETKSGFYAEIPINIKLTGDYHGMGGFVSDVAAMPRVVTINDISIGHNKGVLTMEAVAKTFRYLDDKEMADQKAAEQPKPGVKK